MSSRRLRSRGHSVDSRAGSVQGNLDENSLTDFSQEGEIMTGEIREPEVMTPNPNLGNTNNENSIINLNSDEQHNNIFRDQLQDFLNIVMQAIRAEIAVLQEESKKQTFKLTSVVESLRSEIKRENERLAKSLTAKFEAAHDKIKEDF